MDKLLGFVSEIEQAIRYVLSGAMIVAIGLLSRSEPFATVGWAERNSLLAGVIVIGVGVAAYTVYRIAFWVVGDCMAWRSKASAPSLQPNGSYPRAYAWFLPWRQSDKLSQQVSRYLWYRWAAAHFTLLFGLALMLAVVFKDNDSFIAYYCYRTLGLAVILMVLGVLQCRFLFQVERELRRAQEQPSHKDVALAAYYLWESEGCPEGRSEDYWLRVEEQLRWRK